MAQKPNNPTHDFGDQQFETMLRRHLRRGGATVTPCAGFDAEAANAYLERALLASAQQSYETHLAGCVGCRQHVIALVRLQAELAPQPVNAIAPIVLPQPAAQPFWSRWTAQANAWWMELNGNWGLASAGALATVLIATMAIYGWRQRMAGEAANSPALAARVQNSAPSAEGSVAINTAASDAAASTTASGNALSSALSEEARAPMAPSLPALSLSTTATTDLARSETRAEAPSLPKLGQASPSFPSTAFAYTAPSATPVRVIEMPAEVVSLRGERVAAPVVTLPGNRDFFGGSLAGNNGMQGTPVTFNPSGGLTPIRLNSIEPQTPLSSLNLVKDQLERQSNMTELVVADARQREQADKNEKAAKSEPGRARAIINTIMGQRGVLSFAPTQGDNTRTKEAEKTSDQPLVKPLTKRVNGHTFYFERGFWIDEEYKSDTILPLVKMTRGSERFQQILIGNPTLEQFFQLGQVIVVWKGKVYEVRK